MYVSFFEMRRCSSGNYLFCLATNGQGDASVSIGDQSINAEMRDCIILNNTYTNSHGYGIIYGNIESGTYNIRDCIIYGNTGTLFVAYTQKIALYSCYIDKFSKSGTVVIDASCFTETIQQTPQMTFLDIQICIRGYETKIIRKQCIMYLLGHVILVSTF